MNIKTDWRRSLTLGLAVLAGLVIYAYGFQVTKINLDETRSERRQASLVRILRALAKPDIIAYDREETQVNAAGMMPCPAGGFTPTPPDPSGPYLVVTPACVAPGGTVTVEGFNFEADSSGALSFIPPSNVSLRLATFAADASGHFFLTTQLPERDSEEAQAVQAVTRRSVGGPRFSQNALDTWDKIIETVFLALLATTAGVAISIPVSFLAASNVMKPITSPLASVSLSLLALPLGLALGAGAAQWTGALRDALMPNAWLASAVGLVAAPLGFTGPARWALPPEEAVRPSLGLRLARLAALLAAALVGLAALHLLSSLSLVFGRALAPRLGAFGFLGTFISGLGDILGISLIVVSALGGAAVLTSATGRLGEFLATHLSVVANKLLNLILTTAAGAMVFASVALGLNWLYEIK